jgi:hypothetical protein
MFRWYFSTAGPGHDTPIRQGVTVDKQKLLLFLFACMSVFWADIPVIESNPCFEGNFIAKLAVCLCFGPISLSLKAILVLKATS